MTYLTPEPAVPHRYLPRGYAAGSPGADEMWLTVWGSAYDGRLVYATAEEAGVRAEWLRERAHPDTRGSVTVRYVERSGAYYRIVPDPTSDGLDRS